MTSENERTNKEIRADLTQLLASIEMAGHAVLPVTVDPLLNTIVEAAARIFNAAAASILLLNEKESVLEFRVAYGSSNRDLVGLKFPMDKGIAGYVVMTGQPLSVSNVRQDPRFNQDFASSTGYVPNSILATPLLVGERVIGVMEVLDKVNAPSFGMQDMELVNLFARQAAIAISQFHYVEALRDTLISGLSRIAREEEVPPLSELAEILERSNDFTTNSNLLALADLFRELSSLGEAEQTACLQILTAFAEFRRATRRSRS